MSPGPYSLVIRGPLGVGKSTIAARVAAAEGGEVISIDRIIEEEGIEEWDRDRVALRSFLRANDFVEPRARGIRERGRPTIVEGNFYWDPQIDDLLARLSGPTLLVCLDAPVPVCIARDAGRPEPRPERGPQAGDHLGETAVRAVHRLVSEVRRGISVDASGSIEQSVRRLLAQIQAWRAGHRLE